MRVLCLFISDLLLIPLVYICAYIFKFKLGFLFNLVFDSKSGTIYHHAQLEPYISNIIVISFIWLICFIFFRLYRLQHGVFSTVDQFILIVKVVSFINLIILALSFLFEILPNSRFVVFYSWLFAIGVFYLNRVLINSYFIKQKKENNYLVIGSSVSAQRIVEKIESNFFRKCNYIGSVYNEDKVDFIYTVKHVFKKIGDLDDIESILVTKNISSLYVVVPDYPQEKVDDLVVFCEKNNVQINLHYSLTNALAGVAEYSDILGMPIVSYKKIELSMFSLIVKRIFDIICSIGLLIIALPIVSVAAFWIKSVSKGPVFFKQERVGFNNKEFFMLKLRTMRVDAEENTGPKWVSKQDDRYIYGGKFLRKFSIDELPQLINILKNEMSLIGPRPERKFFVDQICEYAPYFDLRHKIKGGLTGWAQIHGRAQLTNRPLEKFHYDLYYIKNWSLVLDIKIFIKTIFVIFKAEESY